MKSEEGKIVSVNISEEKHTIKSPVDQVVIDQNGVSGDGHAGPGLRQVSMLSQEHVDSFAEQIGRKIAPGEFAENITTKGIDCAGVLPLDVFKTGDVVLEVTQIGKTCHGDNCAIFREIGKCVMPKQGIFCRVITGGPIKPGQAITFEPKVFRFRIITMSERASRGEYTDRSGPKIEQIVGDFFKNKRPSQFDTCILPDDAEMLKEQLLSGVKDRFDAIFITGGTGIGPKDITPEVVTSLAEKIIPGIMEHIRTTYGREKPNALISRSVAAVIGKTLVYALPGSVKAVSEYTPEILKTLEHMIFMLGGLDTH